MPYNHESLKLGAVAADSIGEHCGKVIGQSRISYLLGFDITIDVRSAQGEELLGQLAIVNNIVNQRRTASFAHFRWQPDPRRRKRHALGHSCR